MHIAKRPSCAILVAAMGILASGHAQQLPEDPLQRCAHKALRGDYGRLQPWQRRGYELARRTGATIQGRAWVTSYYPSEGFRRGQSTRSGVGVSARSAAVARHRWARLRGRYVWTAAYGLRVIEDTGANRNDQVARRKGADLWLDYWFPHPRNQNPVTGYAIWEE